SRGSFMRKSILLLIGKLFGKKVILHMHGGGFEKFYDRSQIKPYIRFIISKADMIICLSELWRNYYASTFKLKRLAIVNNVIEAAPDSLPVIQRNGHVNLLFLGLISDKKGIFDLLDVLNSGGTELNNTITVTIAGNGETERLEKVIHDNHSDGSVKYAGWVNGEQKSSLLNACDAYILPSYFEGLPISILEAMAYGKPVIATDVGGIPEIVKPGYNGWLFKAGDRPALEEILNEVIENKNLLRQYGHNSLELSKNYTPKAVFASLNLLYSQLTNV
ncbi:MAG: glycosyltransferase family 4 protein, partial [Flavitalea sp.]